MKDEWDKKIIKDWEEFAPELTEYLNYIHEFMKEHDKRVDALEKHCGLDLPF